MVFIYALVCEELVLYVGRTIDPGRREREHRCISNDCGSKDIPDWMEWEMKLLEEVGDEQGIVKEQHYYDTLKPWYNYRRPGQTHNESRRKRRTDSTVRAREKAYRNTDEWRALNIEAVKRYRIKKALTQIL